MLGVRPPSAAHLGNPTLEPCCILVFYKSFLGLELSYMYINLYPAKLIEYISHQLEVVYRYRDPQLQVG